MPDPREITVDQFTKQAALFASAPEMNNEAALEMLVKLADTSAEDTVLDVACGPGLVACALAQIARRVEGIDLTPAMIDQARARQAEKQLTNVTWRIGDVLPLPYPNASFSIVISRYAFHHLPQPERVLVEMSRVCAPHGTVVVADVLASADPTKAAVFNQMERWRDPSHVRALTLFEMESAFEQAGLSAPNIQTYRLEFALDRLLQGSFPNPGDADKIRQVFRDSLEQDQLGLDVWSRAGTIWFAYPIAVFSSRKGG